MDLWLTFTRKHPTDPTTGSVAGTHSFLISTGVTGVHHLRCQIRWEFESPVIPWLNKFAPSDVILVRSWARGATVARGNGGDAMNFGRLEHLKSVASLWFLGSSLSTRHYGYDR